MLHNNLSQGGALRIPAVLGAIPRKPGHHKVISLVSVWGLGKRPVTPRKECSPQSYIEDTLLGIVEAYNTW